MAASSALSSHSYLSLHNRTSHISAKPVIYFSFLKRRSSSLILVKASSSDGIETFFFENANPEITANVVFYPPAAPEGFVPPPYFDEGADETEAEIAMAHEELYGPAYSGENVLGKDIYVMNSKLKKSGGGGVVSKSKKDNKIRDGFEERVVQVRRVTKVVKRGKQLKFRAIVVVGDKQGNVGVGCAKAKEVVAAVQKSAIDAKRNSVQVPMN